MTRAAALAGFAALAMLALPAQARPARMLVVALCDGGTAHIPIEGGEGPGDCATACHAAPCGRKRSG